MPYRSAKVYNDGSHYIAIPQTNNPTKQKKNPTKTVCTGTELQTKTNKTEKTATEILTPKERFEKIYRENNGKRKAEKIEILTEELKQDFKTEEQTREFIERNIERLQRNKIVRKTRLARKINLNEWNFFCTFTYSNEKHTEESFRKGLREVLKRMVHRKGGGISAYGNAAENRTDCTFTVYSTSPKTVCRESLKKRKITVSVPKNGRSSCKTHTLTTNSDETTSTN